MATVRSSLPHEDRTASEPRENIIEPVILTSIREINPTIRLLRLSALDPKHTIQVRAAKPLPKQRNPTVFTNRLGLVKFSPGQWLDTFIPSLSKAGGFTITSTPSEAKPTSSSPPYLELAVQKSRNPPAQWLWRPQDDILGSQLAVRVGGSFIWPPPRIDTSSIDRLVLVAGGVGINPLISIFAHLTQSGHRPREIHLLYATKCHGDLDQEKILFLRRLRSLVSTFDDPKVTLSLFLTDLHTESNVESEKLPDRTFSRRIAEADLLRAINENASNSESEVDRKGTLCYVCGPPAMTDEFVAFIRAQRGMAEERVLCEKWW